VHIIFSFALKWRSSQARCAASIS